MLFPQFENSQFGHINLERQAEISKKYRKINGKNPLLDPSECQKLIDQYHRQHDLKWSYGGWMETRQKLWSGSYLNQQGTYLHLGVDYNVPDGTEVALPWKAKIIRVDRDNDRDGGWGGRIIAQPTHEKLSDHLFIFAHLSDQIAAQVEETLNQGSIIGAVGRPEVNGGWYSHLHIQAITKAEFTKAMQNDLADLDGYASSAKRKEMSFKFPDPIPFIPFS